MKMRIINRSTYSSACTDSKTRGRHEGRETEDTTDPPGRSQLVRSETGGATRAKSKMPLHSNGETETTTR